MKRKRHTEEQILALLREHEARNENGRSVAQARDRRGEYLQAEAKYGWLEHPCIPNKPGPDGAPAKSGNTLDAWRICFEFRKGDAHEVEITDYHKG